VLTLWHYTFLLHQWMWSFCVNDAGRGKNKILRQTSALCHVDHQTSAVVLWTTRLWVWGRTGRPYGMRRTLCLCVLCRWEGPTVAAPWLPSPFRSIWSTHACALCVLCVHVELYLYFLSHVCFGACFVCYYLCICWTKILLKNSVYCFLWKHTLNQFIGATEQEYLGANIR
jgi:hypothetical protein